MQNPSVLNRGGIQNMSPANSSNNIYVCKKAEIENLKTDIFPLMENGKEQLHIHTAPGVYEVFSKMGGLLYSQDDEVNVIEIKNGHVLLKNTENETEYIIFTIPQWLFENDFISILHC